MDISPRVTLAVPVALVVLGLSTGGASLSGQDSIEHLVISQPDGTIVAEIDGDRSRVVIAPALARLLLNPEARFTLTHNHPHGVGLSAGDLELLGRPGIARIIAVGSDGSRYEAARGRLYDERHF